jgi:hypothetical protein
MSLQFDPVTGKITYNGRDVGEHVFDNGKSTVRINIQFETIGEWIEPISWFAHGLSLLPENQPAPSLLEIESSEESIEQVFEVVRYLTEKPIKRGGYVWKFHKTDADDWPSPLHGHEYDKHLKLDVLTGDVYDVGTRQRCEKLKKTALNEIRAELRKSKDFQETMKELLPET